MKELVGRVVTEECFEGENRMTAVVACNDSIENISGWSICVGVSPSYELMRILVMEVELEQLMNKESWHVTLNNHKMALKSAKY